MITAKTVWHLEKEGRHLFIDKGSSKKECSLIISSSQNVNTYLSCAIRAMTQETAKKLHLKKYICLREETFVLLGPFFIRIDKTEDESGGVNILIEEASGSFYYLNSTPLNRRLFSPLDTILLPAEKPLSEISERIFEYIVFSGIKNIIFSGEFAKEWSEKLTGNISKTILQNYTQLELF